MVHELVDQVNAVVDGEIVAFDERGRNSFEALQQRMNLQGQRAIARASKQIPVALVVFDLLWLDGHETTGLGAGAAARAARAGRGGGPRGCR